LIFSISGLRGISEKELTCEMVSFYTQAFVKFLNARLLVLGRDTRKSGIKFEREIIKSVNLSGCDVVNLKIAPTPTVVFMVKKLKAHGGIVITASHNPKEYNGLKFVSPEGRFLNGKEFLLFNKFLKEFEYQKVQRKTGSFWYEKDPLKFHIKEIIKILNLKNLGFKVGVDAVNGSASEALPELLNEVGCEVHKLNCAPGGDFVRGPEPTPENIQGLCSLVRKKKLDLGFALDPDGDRLAIVDEKGRPLSEENTIVLATDYILSQKKGNVVVNLSTTALMDYVVKKHHAHLYRTKVGEPNVVERMEEVKAVIGGEGNGGVIYPEINMTRDALTGAGIILKLLKERKKKVAEIIDSYPKYYMIKEKISLSKKDFEQREKYLIKKFSGKIDRTDGLKITTRNFWIHIRPSNTEPLVRLIGEGRDWEEIERIIREVEKVLRG